MSGRYFEYLDRKYEIGQGSYYIPDNEYEQKSKILEYVSYARNNVCCLVERPIRDNVIDAIVNAAKAIC